MSDEAKPIRHVTGLAFASTGAGDNAMMSCLRGPGQQHRGSRRIRLALVATVLGASVPAAAETDQGDRSTETAGHGATPAGTAPIGGTPAAARTSGTADERGPFGDRPIADDDRSRPTPDTVQPLAPRSLPRQVRDDPRRSPGSWFTDGGIVPFVYVSTAVAVATELGSPPGSPLGFAPSEGGAERRVESIPNYQVGVIGGALTLTLGAFDRDARWYHVKGMLQSFATTAAATQLAKIGFGRHRPSYDPTIAVEDDRKSFFSGHASLTATTALYLGIYLHQHGFAPWRGERAIAWWEVPAYAGLTALAVYVPYTRVAEHKHHVSDVLTGAAVGSAFAIGFYTFQERRFRRATTRTESPALGIVPWVGDAGASVTGAF